MATTAKIKKNALNISSILGGTVSMSLSAVIVKIIGVVYKIPLASILGDAGMGYFNSAYTVYGLFYILCSAGVPKAVTIMISRAKSEQREFDEYNIVRIASRAYFLLGACLTVLLIILSEPLAVLIGNSGSTATIVAVAPSIIFISTAGVVRGALNAGLQFGAIATAQIIEGVGKLVLGLVFANIAVAHGAPLPIVSCMTILGVTFGSVFGLAYMNVCYKTLKKKIKTRQRRKGGTGIALEIFRISFPITLSAAVMSVTNLIDLGVVMRRLCDYGYSTLEANTLYGNYTTAAVPVFNLILAVITPISVTFLPLISKAHASRDLLTIRSISSNAILISNFVAIPLALGMSLFPEEFMSLLFKNLNGSVGATLIAALMPAVLFMSPLLIVNTTLEACGVVRGPLVSILVGGVVKLLVSYTLVGGNLGILGAPISTIISYFSSLVVSVAMLKAKHGYSFACISSFVVPFVNSALTLIPIKLLAMKFAFILGDTPAFVLAIVLSIIVYTLFSFLTGVISYKRIEEIATYTK